MWYSCCCRYVSSHFLQLIWVLHLPRLPALATHVAMQRHRQSTTEPLDHEERRNIACHIHHGLTATLAAAKAGALARSGTRKLFSLFVYHEESLLSSGYSNWDALGCGVFTDTTKTMEFVDFMTDSDNRVGELNLDIVPLYKNFNTLIENYDVIINNATTHNISINFLESNLIPGDSCQENCPESCSAAPNSRNDSCTPTYMNLFHNTTASLFERYSKNSAFDYEFGLVYDIEQSDPTVNRDVVWDSISKLSNELIQCLNPSITVCLLGLPLFGHQSKVSRAPIAG